MHYCYSLLILLSGTALAVAESSPRRGLVKKSSLNSPPSGWEILDTSPSPNHLITLQIGLKQHNFEGLVEELYKVSDPDHPSYGKHLSKRYVVF